MFYYLVPKKIISLKNTWKNKMHIFYDKIFYDNILSILFALSL